MKEKETILLLEFNNNERSRTEAIRQCLEGFNFEVMKHRVERPNDFISVLSNDYNVYYDYLILCCNGLEEDNYSKIVMPKLNEDKYEDNEPKEDFGAYEVNKYMELGGRVIISTGSFTGGEDMGPIFSNDETNIYIAPSGKIKSGSGLLFIVGLFYYMSTYDYSIYKAYEMASEMNEETRIFKKY